MYVGTLQIVGLYIGLGDAVCLCVCVCLYLTILREAYRVTQESLCVRKMCEEFFVYYWRHKWTTREHIQMYIYAQHP